MRRTALYLKSIALRGLPELIRELGGSPEQLFARADLNIAHIESGGFFDWSKACTLLELAAVELNEPSLGIKWAHRLPMDFLNGGPMLLLAGLTTDVRDFFDIAIKYQKLHNNGVHYDYVEDLENNQLECRLSFHPLTPACRQFAEHIMAYLIILERHHLNTGNFTSVTFQHTAPVDTYWHEKTFKCPVSFSNAKTAAYTKSDYLNLEIGGKLKAFQPILRLYLKGKTQSHPQYNASISATIEQLLPTLFGAGVSNMTKIAEVLEISPKKLQRLLNAEDASYLEILENVRKRTTKRLLFESDISISQLAALLDYSSSEAFNAACKRWVGLSPSKYRKKLRATTPQS